MKYKLTAYTNRNWGQKLSEWIRKHGTCCLQETDFKYRDTNRIKVEKEEGYIMLASGVAILILDMANFRARKVVREKDNYKIKGLIHQEDLTILNVYVPKKLWKTKNRKSLLCPKLPPQTPKQEEGTLCLCPSTSSASKKMPHSTSECECTLNITTLNSPASSCGLPLRAAFLPPNFLLFSKVLFLWFPDCLWLCDSLLVLNCNSSAIYE